MVRKRVSIARYSTAVTVLSCLTAELSGYLRHLMRYRMAGMQHVAESAAGDILRISRLRRSFGSSILIWTIKVRLLV